MRRFLPLLLLVALLCCACSTPGRRFAEGRVLFVGNSLIYVGNTPAVYAALSASAGRPVATDMIVRGGATLHQRLTDGSVARALQDQRYSVLVLQERGGDLMCSFGRPSCAQSRQAVEDLAILARNHGTRVFLLGTYQANPQASRELVAMESEAAAAAGIPYIEVSETLQQLRAEAPELKWFAADGMHPGTDLALLNGLLVHRAVQGALPAPMALTVQAPIYDSRSGLTETLRSADAPPPLSETPLRGHYSQATMARLIRSLDTATGH